ncbi:unnamed protein product [Blumeria hordei]|uniref:Uncharacterized protein n=1 Tax=Blumeria hordei TaxID=2867405 RepID=A0A383V3N8_BLUHO|nr:unnamed protein product [Blumeria hordei]
MESSKKTLSKRWTLRQEILGTFRAAKDLEGDSLENWNGNARIPWDKNTSFEEMEGNTFGLSSNSPGIDRVTVRPAKTSWEHINNAIHGLYSNCLALGHFPHSWK